MKDKIKVLWVTNALGCGGAERQMLYMYDILNKYSNIDVTILYYARVGDELNIDSYNTIFIDKSKIGKLRTIWNISKYIKQESFQIVHAFGGSSANIYGRSAAIFTKAVPVGAMLGKRHFVQKPISIINSFINLFGNWWTVNNNELIPILKKDLKFVSDSKIRLLHNGFFSSKFVNYHKNQKLEFDIDKKDNFIFTAIGRLQPVKNYPLFLKAAQKILSEFDNVKFWLVGNGDEYDKLVSLADDLGISKKVKFWGYRSDVDDILYRTDVFVQTSFTEGSPNTIAEAMRAQKPLISTLSTDLSEMILDEKNGYIVSNDNELELVEAMRKMLKKSAEERKEMGKISEKLFNANFLDVNVAKEFDDFYHEILNKKSNY